MWHMGQMWHSICFRPWSEKTRKNTCCLTAPSHHPTKISLLSIHLRVLLKHYNDVIMGAIASQITSLTIVYSSVYSGAGQSKHQIPRDWPLWGIHRGPVNSPHKWPVTRKMFPFDDVIMDNLYYTFNVTDPSTSVSKPTLTSGLMSPSVPLKNPSPTVAFRKVWFESGTNAKLSVFMQTMATLKLARIR